MAAQSDSIFATPGIGQPGTYGKATLVSGTVAITIPGLTSASEAFLTVVTPIGTLGVGYKAVCTANTLTITAYNSSAATQTLDVSVLRYSAII